MTKKLVAIAVIIAILIGVSEALLPLNHIAVLSTNTLHKFFINLLQLLGIIALLQYIFSKG
jgi:hypothetical protein